VMDIHDGAISADNTGSHHRAVPMDPTLCPECHKYVDAFDVPEFGRRGVWAAGTLTAYWHPGVGFADVPCNMPKAGPWTMVGPVDR
jgi:hypothetical protein